MSAAKLMAKGVLKNTPLCELLVYTLQQRLSGSLVLESRGGEKHAIVFSAGEVRKLRVSSPSTRLGSLLQELGYASKAMCQAAASAGEGLFGQRLLQQGLSEEHLQWGLGHQFLRQMALLSQLESTTAFGFYRDADLLSAWGGRAPSVDALASIWAAVREAAPNARMAQACASVSRSPLRLHPSSRVARFGFQATERALVDVLRVKPQPMSELREAHLVDDRMLERIVYALVLTGHLDVGKPPLGVAPSEPRRRAAPAPSSPGARGAAQPKGASSKGASSDAAPASSKPRRRSATRPAAQASPAGARAAGTAATGQFLSREEIEEKRARLDDCDFYELLGIPRDTPSEKVAPAFAALARRWHPDRVAPDCVDLKGEVTRIFARMTEGHRTLANPQQRSAYDQRLGDPDADDEQQKVAKVLQAAGAFQKAEVMVKKKDFAKAEELARLACEGDSEQPEYAALYAWIRTQRPNCDQAELSRSVDVLRGSAHKQPQNLRIRYYLATAYKRAGRMEEALREYRFVAGGDPSNLEAVREVRLHSMRKTDQKPKAEGGLFGRLFKR